MWRFDGRPSVGFPITSSGLMNTTTLRQVGVPFQAHDTAKGEICTAVIQRLTVQFERALRAIVLTGSLARGEGTLIHENGYRRLLGDADFLLLFHSGVKLPDAETIEDLCHAAERDLIQAGLLCKLGASAAHVSFLACMKPHIFAYELRICGEVVWGAADILKAIPSFSRAAIPLEDGYRLLTNRIIETLIALALEAPVAEVELGYAGVKLYLDIATSFLLFVGRYAPTYKLRCDQLMQLADTRMKGTEDLPIGIADLAESVAQCTQYKTGGLRRPAQTDEISAQKFTTGALRAACALWRWEVSRLTGVDQGATEALMLASMHLQPMSDRLCGWAHVVRKENWVRSWREWPRWLRMAWRATPRGWINLIAIRLAFALGGYQDPPEKPFKSTDPNHLLRMLPRPTPGDMRTDWRSLAKWIFLNYQLYLQDTRA